MNAHRPRLAAEVEVALLVGALVLVVAAIAMAPQATALLAALGAVLLVLLVLRVIGAARAEQPHIRRLRHLADHDALTGLPNRAAFIDRLERSWSRSREVAVLYIDLDGFKQVNDTCGHGTGDDLLVEVAGRLATSLRERDVAARFGGDEFVAFLADCGREDALGVAERLRVILSEPYRIHGREVRVSASIGLCPPGATDEPASAMRKADLALYKAKEEGRDRVCEFDDDLARESERWQVAAEQLTALMHEGGLRLAYLPEIDLVTGEVVSMEALLRTDGLALRSLPIDRLVAAVEEHGAGAELTAWVLDRALSDAAGWRAGGWGGRVSVNVCGRRLSDDALPAMVGEALHRHGLDGDVLTLEFSEGGIPGLREGAARVLDRLRDMGVRVALDDFGSGPSSLALLRGFPWDVLKVERSLVASDDGLGAPLARLVGELGHEVVAEGIETPGQLAAQRVAGVRRGQGYLLAAPLRPEDAGVIVAVGSVVLPS